jgi:hypothetical protein
LNIVNKILNDGFGDRTLIGVGAIPMYKVSPPVFLGVRFFYIITKNILVTIETVGNYVHNQYGYIFIVAE